LNGIDVPVVSWGIFLGVLGSKNRHIILAQKHNFEKIREVGKKKIIKVLAELSRKGAVPRKRILSIKQAYPSHEEFMKKLEELNNEELAIVLKRLGFLAQTKIYLFWPYKTPNDEKAPKFDVKTYF
jgi:hypothetical protein